MNDRDRMKDLWNDMEKAISGDATDSTENKHLVELTEREMMILIVAVGTLDTIGKNKTIIKEAKIAATKFAQIVPKEKTLSLVETLFQE